MYWINCKNYDKHNDTPINEVVIANFDNREDCLTKIDEIINNSVRVKRFMKYKDGGARIEFWNGRANEYTIGTDEKDSINKKKKKKRLDRIEKLLQSIQPTDEKTKKLVSEAKTEVKDIKEIKVKETPELAEKMKEWKETPSEIKSEVVEPMAENVETEKPKTRKKKIE